MTVTMIPGGTGGCRGDGPMSAPYSTLVGLDAVRAWLRDQLAVLEAMPKRHLTWLELRERELLGDESAAPGGAEAKHGLVGPAGVSDALSEPPRAADGSCAPGAACVLLGAVVEPSAVTSWGQWAILALILAVMLGAMWLMIRFALHLDAMAAEREREAEEALHFDHRKVPTDGRWR